MRRAGGFTLVELMIVVGIISILAAIALPAYQSYAIRAKMSGVILALAPCRASITEVYQSGPADAPGPDGWGCEIGASEGTQYVSAISTDANGIVTATVRNIGSVVDGSVVTLIPLGPPAPGTPASFTAGSALPLLGWTCGGAGTTVPAKYLPASCRP